MYVCTVADINRQNEHMHGIWCLWEGERAKVAVRSATCRIEFLLPADGLECPRKKTLGVFSCERYVRANNCGGTRCYRYSDPNSGTLTFFFFRGPFAQLNIFHESQTFRTVKYFAQTGVMFGYKRTSPDMAKPSIHQTQI